MVRKSSANSSIQAKNVNKYECYDYVALVDIIRKTTDNTVQDLAFREIERRLQPMLNKITRRLNIPGSERKDVYQEALFALMSKAIKDYDPTRGNGTGPYPFENFAKLCIVRHLSTKIKARYQNKDKVWINVVSLEQERGDSKDEGMRLLDIKPGTEEPILDSVCKTEFDKNLYKTLYQQLSPLEKEVFLLYLQRMSYEEIADALIKNKVYKKRIPYDKVLKSTDNALSRIKTKGKNVKEELLKNDE